ncbi:MAG: DEAD/DEAH box helicase family protein [Marinoscillum sp.]|uniref:DEAD/DEAH box helicase family protein n=1 Tax=Marinoscillum sp. TaxID=2024838 RepID=UPI0032FF15B5
MLRDADFKPVYASGEYEPAEFFIEALVNSNSFDLGLGYFSSSGFRALSIGFAYFLKRGGKMRIIVNNILSEEDKNAILKGQQRDIKANLEKGVINDILKLKDVLSKSDEHFFNCLSWLIATNRLEIKATIPKRNKSGIVHQKFGIFEDQTNDQLAFTGSINFSANALINNVESLTCDYSWNDSSVSKDRITHFKDLFHKTWMGFSDVVEIIPMEKTKAIIRGEFPIKDLDQLIEDELSLIQEFSTGYELPESYQRKVDELISKLEPTTLKIKSSTELPKLREYQEGAIKAWKDNGYQGMLAMATGTGKTFTALAATWELIREKERLFIIISCPFIHLAEQWCHEALKFGLDSILVGESRDLWEEEAARQAQLFRRKRIDRVVLITTNASFSSPVFQKIIGPCIEESLLIIDEAHYAGAFSIRQLLPTGCSYRLGLSATPERHGDVEGTLALLDYFDKIVFEFPIKDAIGRFLTPYYYYPIPVELTEEEFAEYCSLSDQIVRLVGKDDLDSKERLEKLAIKRARVQNNSTNKVKWVRENIQDKPLDFSLFYAGDQIFGPIKELLGKDFKIKLHEFTSRQNRKKRRELLKEFGEQKIQSLMAMKCLDEGVDVPPTRVAFFLASSGNPREFVQRRGRVLRKHPGKEHAIIYDLVSMPPQRFIVEGRNSKSFHAVKSAFTKEYKRVQEFSSMAINQYDSMNQLYAMADQLDLLDITKD